MSNFLNVLNKISSIKKTEVILPIACKDAIVTPLTVGDDLTLKSSIMSPGTLDMDLIKLIYNHSEFIRPEIDETDVEETDGENKSKKKKKKPNQAAKFYKPKFNNFISEISHIDKLMFMWGIYKSTYETLGEREIRCDKCKEVFKQEIELDNIIQEDSIELLEEEKRPFYKHTEVITVNISNGWTLEFTCSIPTIKRYNNIMSMLPIEEIQSNLEKLRSAFNTTQFMALSTKKLAIYQTKKPDEREETTNIQEIMMALKNYVEITVSEEFLKKYEELFGKYMIRFYTPLECPECHNKIDHEIDIEYEL